MRQLTLIDILHQRPLKRKKGFYALIYYVILIRLIKNYTGK
jgi:hypothetical protein